MRTRVAFAAVVAAPAAAQAAPPLPFGHACAQQGGVRFCPAKGSFSVRVSKLVLHMPTLGVKLR
jgi:hypothetical protein